MDDIRFPLLFSEEGEEEFRIPFEEVNEYSAQKHSELLGKDEEDQHPISAITGLSSTLAEIQDKHYVYKQNIVSEIWHIVHNLKKHPSVTIVDSAGSVVIGDIDYIDDNILDIKFKGAFSGKAYLN